MAFTRSIAGGKERPAALSSGICLALLAVVVEADFPDAFRANLYVRGLSKDATADQALGEFKASQAGCVAEDILCEGERPGEEGLRGMSGYSGHLLLSVPLFI